MHIIIFLLLSLCNGIAGEGNPEQLTFEQKRALFNKGNNKGEAIYRKQPVKEIKKKGPYDIFREFYEAYYSDDEETLKRLLTEQKDILLSRKDTVNKSLLVAARFNWISLVDNFVNPSNPHQPDNAVNRKSRFGRCL